MKIDDNTKKLIVFAAVAAVAGVGVWLIVRKLRNSAANTLFGRNNSDYTDALTQLQGNNEISEQITQTAKITRAKAEQLAAQIKNAWGVNDDEEAVFAALSQLQNYSDWLLLVDAYGVRSGMFGNSGLWEDLNSKLSKSERLNAQNILNSKGINVKIDL